MSTSSPTSPAQAGSPGTLTHSCVQIGQTRKIYTRTHLPDQCPIISPRNIYFIDSRSIKKKMATQRELIQRIFSFMEIICHHIKQPGVKEVKCSCYPNPHLPQTSCVVWKGRNSLVKSLPMARDLSCQERQQHWSYKL